MNLAGAIVTAIVVVAVAWLVLVAIVWLHRPSRELARSVLRLIPDLVRLVRSLLAEPSTPRSVKVALGGLLVYLVSPLDLIPDLIPVIGSFDDVIVSGLVLRWAGRRIGSDALRAHWMGSPEGFETLRRLLGLAEHAI